MQRANPSLRAPLVIIVLTVPIVLLVNWLLFAREPGGYELTAEFSDASGLVKNSNVKIGGVDAGTITDLELTEDDTALATIKLEEEAGVVGEDASAAARPVNLLGEKYVDLDVGDTSKPAQDGELAIPLARTSTPVELDDVLSVLDSPTRARLRILINEAGIAMAGRGADFNAMLEQLPPAIDELHEFIAEVESENERLGLVIEEGDRVLSAITPRRDELGRLVDRAGEALEVTTSRREQLAETFRQAPGALAELRATLAELDATSDALGPTASKLEATAEPLTRTLAALPAFADSAAGTLQTARDVAPSLTELGRSSTPTIERLRPTASKLERFAAAADPISGQLAEGGSFEHMMGLMHGWANSIKTEDGIGNVFGIQIIPSENLVRNAVDRYLAANTPGSQPELARDGATARTPQPTTSSPDSAAAASPQPAAEEPPAEPAAADDDPLGLDQTRQDLLEALDDIREAADLTLRELRKLTTGQLRELVELPRREAVELLEDVDGLLDGASDSSAAATTTLLDFLFGP